MGRFFKSTLKLLAVLLALIAVALTISYYYNKSAVSDWITKPVKPGKLVNLDTHKLYATIKGNGDKTAVVLTGHSSFSWEWWRVQDKLSEHVKVVTYDRAGYGWSQQSPEGYSNRQVIDELYLLLQKIEAKPPYILIGHSAGCIYTKMFAKAFPDDVYGAVFVDPLVITDEMLASPEMQEAIEKDNYRGFFMRKMLATLGLVRIYGKNVLGIYDMPEDMMELTISALSNPEQYDVMKEHFFSLYQIDDRHFTKLNKSFPDIPVRLVQLDSEFMIAESVKDGELSPDGVERARKYWADYKNKQIKHYKEIASKGKVVIAKGSRYNLQYTNPEVIIDTVKDLLDESR